MADPLLTIAIPTFNRAAYLALGLQRLGEDMARVTPGLVELIVSDNASTDGTPQIIAKAQATGLPLRVIRNARNIGADANTAQCFDEARGRYVLILGDDDLLVQGALPRILSLLRQKDYGVVCLRPYGYDDDPGREQPLVEPRTQRFDDAGAFLVQCGALVTFISACIVNKALLPGFSARPLCGGHLVQMHAVLTAALTAPANLFVFDYLVACKRNNSGGYDFAAVFVDEFGGILDSFVPRGLTQSAIAALERRMILAFHPSAIARAVYRRDARLPQMHARYARRFGDRAVYRLWLAPLFVLPRPLALAWAGAIIPIGRLRHGDFRRGLQFLRSRMRGNSR